MIRQDLLATIRKTDDDSARLVYADWLEEQNELPRAMLIRVQCELAGLPSWDRRWLEASWEEDALLAEHGEAWRAELPALEGVEWTTFARGFPSTVRVKDAETLYRHAAAITAAAPVSCVELATLDEREVPETDVSWIEVLRLTTPGEEQPHPQRWLLSAVSALEILGTAEMYPVDLAWLVRRPDEPPLLRFTLLGRHTIGRHFAQQLCAAPWSKTLERLELGTSFIDWDSGYFNDPTMLGEGALLLAGAKLANVTVLDVSRQRLGTDGLAAVLASMPNLEEVLASGCEATAIDVLAHAGTPVRRLDLAENELGNRGAQVLATAPRLASLEALGLGMCELGGPGIAALAAAPFWSTVQTLDLDRNPLGLDGVIALLAAPTPSRLHTLRLADIDLTAAAADLLAEIPWLRRLLRINLSTNEISATLLAAIGAGDARDVTIASAKLVDPGPLAPLWERAIHLDLSDNPIGDAGLDALVTDAPSSLQTLDLHGCTLSARAIDILVERARCPRLHTLILRNNAFDAAALGRLVNSSLVQSLEVLDLSHCGLADDLVPVLLAAAPFARLHTLRLFGSEVSLATVFAIAEAASLRGIKRITLSGDPWDISDVDDDSDEASARENAQRAALIERFGNGWWYEEKITTEIPEYYRRLREQRAT